MEVVAFGIEGFCADELKPPGPVHEYVAPATLPADRFKVLFTQTGPLLDADGAAGMGLTVTVTVCGAPAQALDVDVGVTV